MTYSVTVTNNSGAAQSVAIFMAVGQNAGDFSLVWQLNWTASGGSARFQWDETAYGLGWGTTSRPIDAGVQYQSGNVTDVDPRASQGHNVLPIRQQNGSFISGPAYFDSSLSNQLEIITDTSFTVLNSLLMSVALYMDGQAALAIQGAPNTYYVFDLSQLSYFLTVTDAAKGVALPRKIPVVGNAIGMRAQIPAFKSISVPTRIAFGPGATDLKYTLNGNLMFQKS